MAVLGPARFSDSDSLIADCRQGIPGDRLLLQV